MFKKNKKIQIKDFNKLKSLKVAQVIDEIDVDDDDGCECVVMFRDDIVCDGVWDIVCDGVSCFQGKGKEKGMNFSC